MTNRRFAFALAGLAALLCWRPAAAGEENLYRHNVVIVLDASGSMGDGMRSSGARKMVAAKQALHAVLRQVPQDTQIGLLVFSGRNVRNEWLYPLGPRDDAALAAAIEQPQPGGGTPLGAYLKKGADKLLEQRAAQHGYGTFRLLIVTDGKATDEQLMEKHAPEVVARGITLDVIGVDMAGTHTLAAMAHSYRRADNPESLKAAIAAVFAEVAGSGTDSAGEDLFAEIAPLPAETALAAIKALAASGNDPIGGSGSADAPDQAPATGAVTRPQTPSRSSGAKTGRSDPGAGTAVLVGVVIAVIIIRGIMRRARGMR